MICQAEQLLVGIDRYRRVEGDSRDLLSTENGPDRCRDVTRIQGGGGNLIDERLEKVVVTAIDQPISTRSRASARAAYNPPNPPPTMTTFGVTCVMASLIVPWNPGAISLRNVQGSERPYTPAQC